MLVAAALILAGVMAAALLALRSTRPALRVSDNAVLVGGGLAFPFVALLVLLVISLGVQRELLESGPQPWRVEAVTEQWNWRFSYPDTPGLVTYNVMHAPAAMPIHVQVTSRDVIHSFWVPRAAGKIDAIPGQINRIDFEVTAPGNYVGRCAEYCGIGHAYMRFALVVHPDEAVARAALAP